MSNATELALRCDGCGADVDKLFQRDLCKSCLVGSFPALRESTLDYFRNRENFNSGDSPDGSRSNARTKETGDAQEDFRAQEDREKSGEEEIEKEGREETTKPSDEAPSAGGSFNGASQSGGGPRSGSVRERSPGSGNPL